MVPRKLLAIAAVRLVVLAVGFGMSCLPLEVHADVTGAPEASDPAAASTGATPAGTGELQEVLVTAQKRAEPLKDVPISMTALGGDELVGAQIANYDDLSRAVPGLSFGAGGSEGLDNIEIRGVSSGSGSATVGIYLDDVSITVPNIFFDGSTQPKLFDLDRVEVLRGPQGTLWGASSMGGTIRFVTNQPDMERSTSEFGTDVSGTRHASANYGGHVVENVPLIQDELALRASVGYVYDSGYVDNYSLAGRLQRRGTNDEKAVMGRVSLKYIPAPDWSVTAAVFGQDDRTGDTSVFYLSMPLWTQDKQVTEPGRDRVVLPSVTVQGNLSFADFTSVTGYFDRQFDRWEDGTYYNDAVFAFDFLDPIYPAYAAQNDSLIAPLPSPVHSVSSYRQTSQELRLASHPEGSGERLRWVTGAYFSDLDESNQNIETSPGINQIFRQIYGIPMEQSLVESTYGAPGLVLFPDDNNGSAFEHYRERQAAVFGQADYPILPRLHASAGLRYVSAHVGFDFSSYGFYEFGEPSPYHYARNFSGVTPKYGLSYELSDGSNLYASASKGLRLGGPTRPVPFGPNTVCAGDFASIGVTSQPVKFDSDHLWSYELGTKNRFLDNRLSVDAAVYYIDWKDIQQNIYLPTCGFYFTANVGRAQSYGSELEIHYRPIDGLTVGVTTGANHATITSSSNPQTVQVGEHVLNTPAFTGTASAEYRWRLFSDEFAFARAEYDWTGNSYGSYVQSNSNYYNPGYGVLNGTLGVTAGRWELALYGKNLANDRTIIQRPEINTVIEGYTVRPLTVGLRATVHLD